MTNLTMFYLVSAPFMAFLVPLVSLRFKWVNRKAPDINGTLGVLFFAGVFYPGTMCVGVIAAITIGISEAITFIPKLLLKLSPEKEPEL